jgi:hypothetical protein
MLERVERQIGKMPHPSCVGKLDKDKPSTLSLVSIQRRSHDRTLVFAENLFPRMFETSACHKSSRELLPNFHLGFDVFGARNARFDPLQFMLNFREIGLRHDTPPVRNLRTGFKILDSSFQRSAVNHQPDKDDQQ